MWPIISIVVAVVLVVFFVIMILTRKDKAKRPPDYYNLFMIGLVWFALGIPFAMDGSYFFLAMGIIFGGIGLANKDKWESNRKRWSDLAPEERKIKKIIMVALGALILAGMIAFLLGF